MEGSVCGAVRWTGFTGGATDLTTGFTTGASTLGTGSATFSLGGGVSSLKPLNSPFLSGSVSCAATDMPQHNAPSASAYINLGIGAVRRFCMVWGKNFPVEPAMNKGRE
jgi:hypothetical protein